VRRRSARRAQQLILLGGVTGRDQPGYHDWNNLLALLNRTRSLTG